MQIPKNSNKFTIKAEGGEEKYNEPEQCETKY